MSVRHGTTATATPRELTETGTFEVASSVANLPIQKQDCMIVYVHMEQWNECRWLHLIMLSWIFMVQQRAPFATNASIFVSPILPKEAFACLPSTIHLSWQRRTGSTSRPTYVCVVCGHREHPRPDMYADICNIQTHVVEEVGWLLRRIINTHNCNKMMRLFFKMYILHHFTGHHKTINMLPVHHFTDNSNLHACIKMRNSSTHILYMKQTSEFFYF